MKRLITTYILFFLVCATFAQAKKSDVKFVSGIKVVIDGQLEDWGTQWNTVGDKEPLWTYAIGYDNQYLFVAVKVIDPALQLEAAAHGISVMINKDGKKKEGMQFIFPIPDAETIRSMLEVGDFSAAHVKKELIARSRGYSVKDFPKIVDGLLSLNNAYGLQAIAKVDAADHLVYESAIPLAQLGLPAAATTPVAVEIAIQNRWNNRLTAQAHKQQKPSAQQQTSARIKSPYKGKTAVWVIDKLPLQ